MQELDDLEALRLAEKDEDYEPLLDVSASSTGACRNFREYNRTIEQAMRHGLSNRYCTTNLDDFYDLCIRVYILDSAISIMNTTYFGNINHYLA